MADTTFLNIVNGERVPAASGETYDVIDPSTGEVYASAPMSGREDVDRAYAAGRVTVYSDEDLEALAARVSGGELTPDLIR